MKINSLRDLFEIELWYAYDCEKKLVEQGLPKMIEACSSTELRSALEQHLQETRRHITRLEGVFSGTGTKLDTKGNGILKEIMSAAKDTVDHIEPSALRDAALIVNANQVEHYEIAEYGSLVAFARQLGFQDATKLLEETLAEEKAADAKLTQIAKSVVNTNARAAAAAGGRAF